MTSDRPNRLDERLRAAADRPIADGAARAEKRAALTAAADRPREAAAAVDSVAGMLAESVRSGRALRMVPSTPVCELRECALQALDAIVDVVPEAVGTDKTVRTLAEVAESDAASTAVRRAAFDALGWGGDVDPTTAEDHLLKAIQVGSGVGDGGSHDCEQDPTVRRAAITAAGRCLATGVPRGGQFVDVFDAALDADDERVRAAAIEAIGRALAGDAEPTDDFVELLDRTHEREQSDPEAVALAACRALSGGSEPRTVGERILEERLSAPDTRVRAAVPRGIEATITDASNDAAEAACDLLRTALDDDSEDVVRMAAVEAAIEAVETRSEAVDPFAELIERVVTVLDGPPSARAVDALGGVPVARSVVDVTDRDSRHFIDAAESAVLNGQAEMALERLATFDAGQFERLAESVAEQPPDESTVADEEEEDPKSVEEATFDAGQFERLTESVAEQPPDKSTVADEEEEDPKSVEDAAEAAVQNSDPCDVVTDFQRAESSREREIVVATIGEWFRTADLGAEKADQLLEVLRTAYGQGEADVDIRALRAATTGLTEGPVAWASVRELLERGQKAPTATVREETVVSVGRALKHGVIDWQDARPWVEMAMADFDDDVRRGAVAAVGRGISSGAVNLGEVDEYLQQAMKTGPESATEEVIRAVGIGVREGQIAWSAAEEYITRIDMTTGGSLTATVCAAIGAGVMTDELNWGAAAIRYRRALAAGEEAAKGAVVTVGHMLCTGNVIWDDVAPFLWSAWEDGSVQVKKGIVVAVGDSLQAEHIGWKEAAPFLRLAREEGPSAVAEQAILKVADCLRDGIVCWETVGEYLRIARDSTDDTVIEVTLLSVNMCFNEEAITWPVFQDFIHELYYNGPNEWKVKTISVITLAISDGRITLEDAFPFINEAIQTDSEKCRQMAVDAIGMGLRSDGRDENIEWSDVTEVFWSVIQSGSVPVGEHAIKAVAQAYRDGAVRQNELLTLSRWARAEASDDIAVEVQRVLLYLHLQDEISLGIVVAFTCKSLADERTKIAKEAIRCIGVLAYEKSLEWGRTRDLLVTGLHTETEVIANEAIKTTAALLGGEVIEWEQASDVLEHVKYVDDEDVTDYAINVAGSALVTELAEWDEIQKFIRSVYDERDALGELLLIAVGAIGNDTDTVDWADLVPVLNKSLKTVPMLEIFVLIAVGDAIQNDIVGWDRASEFFEPPLHIDSVSRSPPDGQVELSELVGLIYTAWLRVLVDIVESSYDMPVDVASLLRTASPDVEGWDRNTARVIIKTLQETDARLESFEPLLADLLDAEDPQTRLRALRAVGAGIDGQTSIADVDEFLLAGLDDPNGGVRAYTIRLVETNLADGGEERAPEVVSQGIDRAMKDTNQTVQRRGVALIEAAITAGVGDYDRHRDRLAAVVGDDHPTSHFGEEARIDALETLVEMRTPLDAVDTIATVLSAGDLPQPVRLAAVESVERVLLEDPDLAETTANRFVDALFEWASVDDESREAAVQVLATVDGKRPLDPSEIDPSPLRRALARDQVTADRRAELVDLLSRVDVPITAPTPSELT